MAAKNGSLRLNGASGNVAGFFLAKDEITIALAMDEQTFRSLPI